MTFRMFCVAVIAGFGASALANPAGAEQRRQPGEIMLAQDNSSDQTFLRKIPGIRLLFGDKPPAEQTPEPARNKKANKNFDESYYEPQPANPSQPKPAAPAKAKPPAKPAKAAQTVAAPISCEQATAVVSGFGFSSVEAASCSGKVYAFNAKRDGKSFAIKLDSTSGELTEVKKLP
jgi:hypothetical protein